MNQLNLDQFRVTESRLNGRKKRRVRVRKSPDWFVKGPIPGDWISRAAFLPGRALGVAIAVRYLCGVERTDTVKLTWRTLQRFCTSHDSGRRGLTALERAKLVEVQRSKGCAPVVKVLE